MDAPSLEAPEALLCCGGGISACAAALAPVDVVVDAVRVDDESLEKRAAGPALPLTT